MSLTIEDFLTACEATIEKKLNQAIEHLEERRKQKEEEDNLPEEKATILER